MTKFNLKHIAISFVAIAVSVGFTGRVSAEPGWDELISFLGVDKDNKEFHRFAGKHKHKLDESTKGPSGSFSTDGHSVSILYRQNIFVRAIVSPRHYSDGLTEYQAELPFGLTKIPH
jgi:hypothetical protein